MPYQLERLLWFSILICCDSFLVQTFFDVLYDPWPTPLAEAAARAGCRVVGGLELLLAQAVGQFELFTGVTAPVAAMEAALRAAVSGAGDDTKRSKVATPQ